jgi:CRP-like cAMP-binding protein
MLQGAPQPPLPRPEELLALLHQTAIFDRCTDGQLQALLRRTRLVRLDAGEILFRHGDKAKALYLLVHGQLKLYRTSADGDEVIVDLVEPGMTFGETRAFRDDPHFHSSCAALRDAEVAVVDLLAFLAVLRDSAEICLLLLRRISERAERQVGDIDRLALQGGACRVASYLLGQLPPSRNEFVLTVPKGVLAARLGLRAESLSRALRKLRNEGIVSVTSGNLVRVPNRQKLQRFVERGARPDGCDGAPHAPSRVRPDSRGIRSRHWDGMGGSIGHVWSRHAPTRGHTRPLACSPAERRPGGISCDGSSYGLLGQDRAYLVV